MDIDKLIRTTWNKCLAQGFGSLMDIDKLIQRPETWVMNKGFGSLMDIDKLIPFSDASTVKGVLVL